MRLQRNGKTLNAFYKSDISSSKPLILSIEDDAITRQYYRITLEKIGCNVVFAENGREAMERFNSAVNLVLLDMTLPDMTGLEVSQEIRCTTYSQGIPIIAITALSSVTEEECYRVGIDKVYNKPILLNELYLILKRWLPHYSLSPINLLFIQ